jgi:hypothetical protein
MNLATLIPIGTTIFFAGAFYGMVLRIRKDQNGMGKKVSRIIAVLIPMLPEKDREHLVRFLLTG